MSNKVGSFFFIRLALASMSAGVGVLVVSLLLVWLGSKLSPWLGLTISLFTVVGTIALIGFISNRMVKRESVRILEEQYIADPNPLNNR